MDTPSTTEPPMPTTTALTPATGGLIPAGATVPVTLSDEEQARIDKALADSRSPNTCRRYAIAWRQWCGWAQEHGHQVLPAAPEAVAAHLAHLVEDLGRSASTVATARSAIAAAHLDKDAPDPTSHAGARRAMKGLRRQAAGRGRGQAQALTADDAAAILATAHLRRETGRGRESVEAAADRARLDKAVVGLLFHAGLRRSEASALTWDDVQDSTDGRGVLVRVRKSKTDQEGTAADTRYVKNGCAEAIRALREHDTPKGEDRVLRKLTGESIARRLTAAAKAAGIKGRVTGHSGRVGLAVELTTRGASTTATMLAGGWSTSRMVAHYSAGARAEQGAVAELL